jgi:hypothetical protein
LGLSQPLLTKITKELNIVVLKNPVQVLVIQAGRQLATNISGF